jgi:hypothetical protein
MRTTRWPFASTAFRFTPVLGHYPAADRARRSLSTAVRGPRASARIAAAAALADVRGRRTAAAQRHPLSAASLLNGFRGNNPRGEVIKRPAARASGPANSRLARSRAASAGRSRAKQPAAAIDRGRLDLADQLLRKPSPVWHCIVVPARADCRFLRAESMEQWYERADDGRLERSRDAQVVLGPSMSSVREQGYGPEMRGVGGGSDPELKLICEAWIVRDEIVR